MTQADATFERFETTGDYQPPFTFAVMYISEKPDILNMDQDLYLNKIDKISNEA